VFAVATFSCSLAALVALFAFKDWELRRDTKFFPGLRERLTDVVETKVLPMKEALPEAGKRGAALVTAEAKRRIFVWALDTLHTVEGLLLRAFLFIRGKRTLLNSSETVSPFLKDIAQHKESLSKERENIQ
jgi:hypothetical protein